MIRPDQEINNADWLKRKGQVEKPAPQDRKPIGSSSTAETMP